MKTMKERIMNRIMMMAVGVFVGCTAMGVGFAASPQIGDAVLDKDASENIWEVVEEQAQKEDWEILSVYMDTEILETVSGTDDSICEMLQAYCSYDTDFYEIVCDYFS